MSDPLVVDIEKFDAPYRRQILLQDVTFESGMKLMRIRIREGTRFTILEVDAPTAQHWGQHLLAWAKAHASAPTEDGTTP